MFPGVRRGRRESRESCRAKQVTTDAPAPVREPLGGILRDCGRIRSCTDGISGAIRDGINAEFHATPVDASNYPLTKRYRPRDTSHPGGYKLLSFIRVPISHLVFDLSIFHENSKIREQARTKREGSLPRK